ncbi:MAG: hypothetical protein IJ111_01240 [Eggerthellaceae bacterium]|nr:hypothetical protein [Eggerthellaceae bacterium]
MSFTGASNGITFNAGHFLADDENCVRESMSIAANHAQKLTINGKTIVPAGAVIPANGASAKGILYEDIDVTNGSKPGSVVTKGIVYGDLLPAELAEDAAKALTGITVIESPEITRPNFGGEE